MKEVYGRMLWCGRIADGIGRSLSFEWFLEKYELCLSVGV